ncbi:MAG: hypothetical protein HQ559_05145 [Lentisphaerae bacterium]|nr:hypothetical protein [Lentisphaerota bacterium]
MKLPEQKQDRMKVLAFVFIGAAGVLYAIVQLGITPFLRSRTEKIQRLAELHSAIEDAGLEITRMEKDQEQNREIVLQILDFTGQHVLRRRLGNLLLGATEVIESHAALMTRGTIDSIREVGVADLPAPKKKASNSVFRLYTVRVTMQAGLHDLLRFIQSLENENPCLCVSSIGIETRTMERARHLVSIEIQWPVWANPELPAELVEQIEEEEKETGAATASGRNSTPSLPEKA